MSEFRGNSISSAPATAPMYPYILANMDYTIFRARPLQAAGDEQEPPAPGGDLNSFHQGVRRGSGIPRAFRSISCSFGDDCMSPIPYV